MKAYYFLGRLLSPFAKIVFLAYSPVTSTKRVRIVVINEHGEVLLLKTWLGANKWGLPGGGVERNEPLEHAAVRELMEETGIRIEPTDLRGLCTLRSMGHDEVVYTVEVPKRRLPATISNRLEVKEAAWVVLEEARSLDVLTERILSKVALKH